MPKILVRALHKITVRSHSLTTPETLKNKAMKNQISKNIAINTLGKTHIFFVWFAALISPLACTNARSP